MKLELELGEIILNIFKMNLYASKIGTILHILGFLFLNLCIWV